MRDRALVTQVCKPGILIPHLGCPFSFTGPGAGQPQSHSSRWDCRFCLATAASFTLIGTPLLSGKLTSLGVSISHYKGFTRVKRVSWGLTYKPSAEAYSQGSGAEPRGLPRSRAADRKRQCRRMCLKSQGLFNHHNL